MIKPRRLTSDKNNDKNKNDKNISKMERALIIYSIYCNSFSLTLLGSCFLSSNDKIHNVKKKCFSRKLKYQATIYWSQGLIVKYTSNAVIVTSYRNFIGRNSLDLNIYCHMIKQNIIWMQEDWIILQWRESKVSASFMLC